MAESSRDSAYHDEETLLDPDRGVEPGSVGSETSFERTNNSVSLADRFAWLQQPSSYSKVIPLPIRFLLDKSKRAIRYVVNLSRGPKEIQIQTIRPFFPRYQALPPQLIERFTKHRVAKVTAFCIYWLSYLLIVSLILYPSIYPEDIPGYGPPKTITCSESFWRDGNGCGLDGSRCHPFDNTTFAFRCPASCIDNLMQEPHPIGNHEVLYHNLVIGGGGSVERPVYRADSLICQSAVHAGVISNTYGGCGVAELHGAQDSFSANLAHGIQTYAFDSTFPKSYTFVPSASDGCKGCRDVRWDLLIVSVVYSTVFSIFVSSPALFFGSSFFMLFMHIAMISDPPEAIDYANLGSTFLSRLVPASFVAFVYYKYTVRRTLNGLTCHLEKTILWLGGAWIGALNNYTFKDIPIQRLTPHDLQQTGAVPALITIILIILTIAFGQAYYLWLEHRFRTYLALYTGMISILLILLAIPDMHLRIHHYLLAMLLLPGTSIQTRPSLLYQGLLVGLFLNGVARWGFAPILETPEMLFSGRPEFNPIPAVSTFLAPDLSRIDFSWSWPPEGYNGVSVLINDVERHRWYTDDGNGSSFSWFRSEIENPHKEYFRLSYLLDSQSVEYTKAGIWEVNGRWTGIPE